MPVYRLPLAFFYSINSTIGIIGNVIMMLCYFKNRKLRSPCHVLITLLCCADILNLGGEYIFAVEIFGTLMTTQTTCFWMQVFAIIGSSAGSPLILAIGIDRLVAVHFPAQYRNIQVEKKRYIALMLIFPFAYTLSMVVAGYETRLPEDTTLTMCPLPVAMLGIAFKMFTFGSAVIYVLVLAVYIAVYISLKTHPTSYRFKRVFHSIGVTVVFVLIGWVSTTLINVVNYVVVTDPVFYEMNLLYSVIPVHFSLTSNAFVFYAINPDYRKTIRALFGLNQSMENGVLSRDSGLKVGPSSIG